MKLKPKVLQKKKKKIHGNSYPEENNPFFEDNTKKNKKTRDVDETTQFEEIIKRKNKIKKKTKNKESKKIKKLEGKRERAISTAILQPEEKIVNIRQMTVLQDSINEIEDEREKSKKSKLHLPRKRKKKKAEKKEHKRKLEPENSKGNDSKDQEKPVNITEEIKTTNSVNVDNSTFSKQNKLATEENERSNCVKVNMDHPRTSSQLESDSTNIKTNHSELTEKSSEIKQLAPKVSTPEASSTAKNKNQNYEAKNPFEEDSTESESLESVSKVILSKDSPEAVKPLKQRRLSKRQRASSIVISSRERKKKKRLKIIKKLKKKKKEKPEQDDQDDPINPRPVEKNPPITAAALHKEMQEIHNVLSDRVIEGLMSRQSNLSSLLKKSESLEDFAGQFAKTNRDIVRKKKTEAKCCGLFSRSRFCWFICTCDRELKLKKKKERKENAETVVVPKQTRAYADDVVEENEPYEKAESSSMPNLSDSRVVLLRNKNNSNTKTASKRNSNDSKTSSTSLLAAVQNRRMLTQLNRTSFPLMGRTSTSNADKSKDTGRKSSSVDNVLNVVEVSPLLDKEARRSIQDHMNRYDDHEQKQKVYELLLMDYH